MKKSPSFGMKTQSDARWLIDLVGRVNLPESRSAKRIVNFSFYWFPFVRYVAPFIFLAMLLFALVLNSMPNRLEYGYWIVSVFLLVVAGYAFISKMLILFAEFNMKGYLSAFALTGFAYSFFGFAESSFKVDAFDLVDSCMVMFIAAAAAWSSYVVGKCYLYVLVALISPVSYIFGKISAILINKAFDVFCPSWVLGKDGGRLLCFGWKGFYKINLAEYEDKNSSAVLNGKNGVARKFGELVASGEISLPSKWQRLVGEFNG